MKKRYRVYVAGRSGGHIIPAFTLAKRLKEEDKDIQTLFFSTATCVDKELFAGQSAVDKSIFLSLGNFPYKKFYKYPVFIAQFMSASIKTLWYLVWYRPDKIVALGGYISIPVCIVGFLLKIPCELFELNVTPGRATKFLFSFAQKFLFCFDSAKKYLPATKARYTEYPVRFDKKTQLIDRKEALAAFTFLTTRKTIMILGGSQGSAFINEVIKEWVLVYPDKHKSIQIIHQTGLMHDKDALERFYAERSIPAFVFDYYDDLQYCYRAADLILCRSGAGTLFEIAFFGKKCITIPLQTVTTSHQIDNAVEMGKKFPNLFTVLKQQKVVGDSSLLFKQINSHL